MPKLSSLEELHVLRNMLLAHGRAYRTIHRIQSNARVGLAHHMRYFLPANPASAADRRVTALMDQLANRSTLEAITAGRLTPPIGVCLYVACGTGGTSIGLVARPLRPFLAVMVGTLVRITYLPPLTLILPRLLLGYQP